MAPRGRLFLFNVMKQTSFDVTTLSDNVVVNADDLDGIPDISRKIGVSFSTQNRRIEEWEVVE